MTYEQGFAQGELDALRDRAAGLPLEKFPPPKSEAGCGYEDGYQRGYRDGYTPRSATWWQPVRERVAA